MIGRAEERAQIGGLLADARASRSGALILTGEPGVGKSMLLEYAVQLGSDSKVLHASGVETEIDLPFAGLHQLVRPILKLVDRLPARQAAALLGALGLAEQTSEDRFLIAAAVLSLLSEAAEDGPVLCVVEDAQWLDHASVDSLAFAARRLDAEGVVVLVATREEPWPGLPARPVEGLSPDEAAMLLRERVTELAQPVGDVLVAEAGGNPLALVELAGSLSLSQLAGREALPDPLRLTGRIRDAFLGRVAMLPEASQTLLLVAAADDTGDPTVVFGAARELGAGLDALEPAERSGLAVVDGGGRITFRHPLVRAAVYQAATFTRRTAAHAALARALEGDVHADRRAWHLAAAATAPDETVARELERSAQVARQRGAYGVAAAGFERAAQLCAQRSGRARLLVAAAQAAYQAGQADRAAGLADRASGVIDDPGTADELACLRGRIELTRGSSVAAYTLLDPAARRIAQRDPRAGAAELIHAARAAWNINDPERLTATTDALAALPLPAGEPVESLASAAIAVGNLVAGRIADAVARIHGATEAWVPMVAPDRAAGLEPWVVEAWLALSGTTRIIGDHPSGLALAAAAAAQCRTRGLAARLPQALVNLARSQTLAGRFTAAEGNATEALELARDLGQLVTTCHGLSVLAWLAAVRGEEERCRDLAAEAVALADAHQITSTPMFAIWALGLLELSLGRPERALDRLLDPVRGPAAHPIGRILIAPDVLEAAFRTGRPSEHNEVLRPFEEWATSTGRPWAAATVHRCQAMLAETGAERHFEAALTLHGTDGAVDHAFDRARTQLLYGQWLRRARQRAAARTQLASAVETFDRLGVTPWAERASSELRATGEKVRPREGADVARLTPQELQVIRLVAEGGSNQDVAAQLFISPRTVAYHLYKAFPKLGVNSRADLAQLDLDALAAVQ